MPAYQITEPHPTALPNHYIHTGRGGAGNTLRISTAGVSPASTSKSSSPQSASPTKSPSTTSSLRPSPKASTGRGGAGNIYPHSSLSTFSLSDAMDAQSAREQGHEVWHVGRGGAGNFASQGAGVGGRKLSSGSEGSVGSGRSGFLGRLSGAFERR